jgi:hypothetical protein
MRIKTIANPVYWHCFRCGVPVFPDQAMFIDYRGKQVAVHLDCTRTAVAPDPLCLHCHDASRKNFTRRLRLGLKARNIAAPKRDADLLPAVLSALDGAIVRVRTYRMPKKGKKP